jgi:hypothetical protein
MPSWPRTTDWHLQPLSPRRISRRLPRTGRSRRTLHSCNGRLGSYAWVDTRSGLSKGASRPPTSAGIVNESGFFRPALTTRLQGGRSLSPVGDLRDVSVGPKSRLTLNGGSDSDRVSKPDDPFSSIRIDAAPMPVPFRLVSGTVAARMMGRGDNDYGSPTGYPSLCPLHPQELGALRCQPGGCSG